MSENKSQKCLKQALKDTFEKFGFIYLEESNDAELQPVLYFHLEVQFTLAKQQKMILFIPKIIIAQMLENLMLENDETKMSDFAQELANTVMGHFLAIFLPKKDFILNGIYINETDNLNFNHIEEHKTICKLYYDNVLIQAVADI